MWGFWRRRRGYLMVLKQDPEQFWYLKDGLGMVCGIRVNDTPDAIRTFAQELSDELGKSYQVLYSFRGHNG